MIKADLTPLHLFETIKKGCYTNQVLQKFTSKEMEIRLKKADKARRVLRQTTFELDRLGKQILKKRSISNHQTIPVINEHRRSQ